MINWGIIGLGNMANVFINSLEHLNDTRVLAIASKRTNKLKQYAKSLKISKNYCFNNYSELINCPLIDIVYITLPNNFHFRYIDEALNKGKHVLVEKPGFISLSEEKNISKIINDGKKFFFEGFSYLHSKVTADIIDLIQNKIIGELLEVNMQLGYCIVPSLSNFEKLLDKLKAQHRLFKKKMGGGCVLDLGCYLISFLQLLINLDNYTIINKILTFGSKQVEIDAKNQTITEEGVKSNLHCSFIKDLESQIEIKGTSGQIIIKNLWSGMGTIVYLNNQQLDGVSYDVNNFSSQISSINSCINYKHNYYNSLLYSNFSSSKNIKFLEAWKS